MMTLRSPIFATLATLASFSTFAAFSMPAFGAPDWRAVTTSDMKFAIETVRSSHAGAVSGQIDVSAPLEQGASLGLIEAASASSEQDYRRAMVRFISAFGDPHTAIQLHLQAKAWTGLVIDHVGGKYRVSWSEPNWPQPLPPRGAEVQGCDGVWIGTYLKSSVAPFSNRSLEYSSSMSDLARLAMFDQGLGWTPTRCTFHLADGASRVYALPLHAISKEQLAEVRKRYVAKARPVGVTKAGANQHWVGMPDFNGARSADAYEKLYAQLAGLKTSSWIIFDLRGNGGGDSSWGNRALKALYGEAYGEQLGATASYVKSLVASPATLGIYQHYASLPEFAASKAGLDADIDKIKAAIARGEPTAKVEESSKEQALTQAASLRARPGGPRIAAVIDRNCFSSCMNFLQQISTIADTVVLGEATIGYSPYGEIGEFKLPSGNGALYIPSAIYTAFQATREPFVPALRYDGDMADDEALMAWVSARLSGL